MTNDNNYVNYILDEYVKRYNEIWPNGISDEERMDLEALGRKQAEIDQQIREEYYRNQKGQHSHE